jgi:hypothetical protein
MKHLLAITGLVLLLAGCSSPGLLISRQDKDAVPAMGKAPADGTYGLFIAGQAEDLYDLPLKQGEPLGFERGNDGVVRWLYAVAGKSKNRLDVTQTYEWRKLP